MSLCLLVSTVLWSATSGYVRYGMVIGVLAFLYLAVFIMDMLALRRRFWTAVLTPLATLSLAFSFLYISAYNFDWSWRPSIFIGANWTVRPARPYIEWSPEYQRYIVDLMYANIPRVLNDHTATNDQSLKSRFSEVKTWICVDGATADAILANPNAGLFVHRSSITPIEDLAAASRRYFSGHSTSGLYALLRNIPEGTFDEYEQCGFSVEAIEEVSLNYMDATQTAYFVKLTYSEGD